MSQDPLGFAARAFDLYGYVYNNPLKMIDPSGLEEQLAGSLQLTGSGWRQLSPNGMYIQSFSDGTMASREQGGRVYVLHPGVRGYYVRAGESRYSPIMAKDYYPGDGLFTLPSEAYPGSWIEYPHRGYRFRNEKDYIIKRLPDVSPLYPRGPIVPCEVLRVHPYFWVDGYHNRFERQIEYQQRLAEMNSEAARNPILLYPRTLTYDYYPLFPIPGWEGASAGIGNAENPRGDDRNSRYYFNLQFPTSPEGGNKK